MMTRRVASAIILVLALVGYAGCGASTLPTAATSPTAGAHTLIYTTAAGYKNSAALVAFDADTDLKVTSYGGTGPGSLTFDSAPAVVDGVAYAGAHQYPPPCVDSSPCPPIQYEVYAIDLRTLTVRWHEPLDGFPGGPPAVVDGVVYATTRPYSQPGGRSVYAFDAQTGAQRWRFEADGGLSGPPVVADGVVYASNGYVYALRTDTGAQLWRSASLVGTPTHSVAVAGGVVYSSNGNRVSALRASDGATLWSTPLDSEFTNRPVAADGLVYVGAAGPQDGDNFLYALDATTGAVRWRFAGGAIVGDTAVEHQAATVASGVVYVGATDSSLHALDATTGAQRWRFQATSYLGYDPHSPPPPSDPVVVGAPVVRDGIAYFVAWTGVLNNDLHSLACAVYAVDTGTGSQRWVSQGMEGLSDQIALAP